jgi:PAS domain S-box-containing protein
MTADFMPHGHCYFWTPELVWLQVIANGSIGLAYFAISLTLAYIVHRIRNMPFQWMYLAFGVFIVACGITHLMDVWVIWKPYYWLDGAIRALTAVASVGTAILLVPLVPKAVALSQAARVAHDRGIELVKLNSELAALYEKSRETLAEAIPQLVWTARPDGTTEYYSRTWTQYTGYTSDFTRAVHPEDREHVLARWHASLVTGEPYEVEVRLLRQDGSYRWFLSRALPLRDDHGRIIRWFGTSTDIHDQKLAAAERETMLRRADEMGHARDVFLAVAAHELRTPLTPLRLEAERLLSATRSAQPEKLTREWLSQRFVMLERQIGRLEGLVTALLDVSRIAAGKLELQLEKTDAGQVVHDVIKRHEQDIEHAGCSLELDIEQNVDGQWDPIRIDQIVTNLLTNALRYGTGKPIRIAVKKLKDRAQIVVQDAGIGIAPEDQLRIFERFERVSSERHYGGLGLGLWLVRQVVEALGGTISVESELGKGAKFTVELPYGSSAPTGTTSN